MREGEYGRCDVNTASAGVLEIVRIVPLDGPLGFQKGQTDELTEGRT